MITLQDITLPYIERLVNKELTSLIGTNHKNSIGQVCKIVSAELKIMSPDSWRASGYCDLVIKIILNDRTTDYISINYKFKEKNYD